MNVLVVIPARGGSKGIPRKNLRSLAGKPLIYYSIQTALKSRHNPDVYVSSEDDEIQSIASKIGAKIHKRDTGISHDTTTLDPVIFSAYQEISQKNQAKKYDLIVTLQPTSPLLRTKTLDEAIDRMVNNSDVDTVIAAKDDTHLSWVKDGDRYLPNYTKRVNRQFLKPTFRETGSFLITRASVISKESRIGENVDLYLLEDGENIDIDTHEDWNVCEYYLRRRKILFVVCGNPEIGLGHVYNTLLVANDILDHHVVFLVDKDSNIAKEKISSNNYVVYQQIHDNILEDIKDINPDVVINDILDTDLDYIEILKEENIKVINFEDLGEGAQKADLVINAIYPEQVSLPNHFFGHNYFVIRDEFVLTSSKPIEPSVRNVLLTFGGVDPNNFTAKVLKSIYQYCRQNNIEINIVTGLGYSQYQTLQKFKKVKIHKNTSQISDFMSKADMIFTSAGRTIYEVASLGVPAIVLAQNEREMTHFFASEKYGFEYLGDGTQISCEDILEKFTGLVENYEYRKNMSRLMKSVDLRSGRRRVQELIRSAVENS